MKFKSSTYQVPAGKKVDLKKWPTSVAPLYKSKDEYHKQLEKDVLQLSEYQNLHYASNRKAMLLIFQGMDAAGKDGVIRHVLSGINPQGCQVTSFKTPSTAELAHDFLWRSYRALPERGRIGVFNRSYYEEVLIVRVHPELLHEETSQSLWNERFDSIVDMENHLSRNGTVILKFFLHISKDEQRKRFADRIADPAKSWKLEDADLKERVFWSAYRKAYAECLGATSTKKAPWYIVPADDKMNARLIVAGIVRECFAGMNLAVPKTTSVRRGELLSIMGEGS